LADVESVACAFTDELNEAEAQISEVRSKAKTAITIIFLGIPDSPHTFILAACA
jgi:hypothetical protein